MTDEQNARLDMARALSGELFDMGDIHGLGNLSQRLVLESEYAAMTGQDTYAAALRAEADMVTASLRFLEAEWRMTNGEAVAHG